MISVYILTNRALVEGVWRRLSVMMLLPILSLSLGGCNIQTKTTKQIEVSRDADGSVIINSQDTASKVTVQTTLRPVLAHRAALDGQVDGLVIGVSHVDHGGGKVPEVTPAHTLSAGIMARQILALFRSGSSRGFSVNGRTWRRGANRIEFLAPLSVSPVDASIDVDTLAGALDYLGMAPVHKYSEPRSGLWDYVQGPRLTRAEIMGSVDAHVKRILELPSSQRPMVVVYIAAHGALSREGRPFILATDSKISQASSMVGYYELVRAYARIYEQRPDIPILMIFDTCQTVEDTLTVQNVAEVTDVLSPAQMLMTSTSPGKYAWHWPIYSIDSISGPVSGFGGDKKVQELELGDRFKQTASLLPFALAAALRECDAIVQMGGSGHISLLATLENAGQFIADRSVELMEGNEKYRQSVQFKINQKQSQWERYAPEPFDFVSCR